jgi:hypothetical protein
VITLGSVDFEAKDTVFGLEHIGFIEIKELKSGTQDLREVRL